MNQRDGVGQPPRTKTDLTDEAFDSLDKCVHIFLILYMFIVYNISYRFMHYTLHHFHLCRFMSLFFPSNLNYDSFDIQVGGFLQTSSKLTKVIGIWHVP